MSDQLSSKEIASALMRKINEAAQGKDAIASEIMCRCTDTLIKLARLEMDYAQLRQEKPQIGYLKGGICTVDEGVEKVKEALKGTW